MELGCESWTSFASGCSSTATGAADIVTLPSTAVETATRSALVAAQWRGDTALTLPLFWRRSTVSPVFFGRYPRSSLHSFVPLFPLLLPPPPPTPSPSLISHIVSVDVKQNGLHDVNAVSVNGSRVGRTYFTWYVIHHTHPLVFGGFQCCRRVLPVCQFQCFTVDCFWWWWWWWFL